MYRLWTYLQWDIQLKHPSATRIIGGLFCDFNVHYKTSALRPGTAILVTYSDGQLKLRHLTG